jgi:hypothetical protein
MHAQTGDANPRRERLQGSTRLTRERVYSMPPALIAEWLQCILEETLNV